MVMTWHGDDVAGHGLAELTEAMSEPFFPKLSLPFYGGLSGELTAEGLKRVKDEVNAISLVTRKELPVLSTSGAWDWLDTLGKEAGFEDVEAFESFDLHEFVRKRMASERRSATTHLSSAIILTEMQQEVATMRAFKKELTTTVRQVERVYKQNEIDVKHNDIFVSEARRRARKVRRPYHLASYIMHLTSYIIHLTS